MRIKSINRIILPRFKINYLKIPRYRISFRVDRNRNRGKIMVSAR